jgi:alkylation response protein AidB-like acyl-CoA dehydrogenase
VELEFTGEQEELRASVRAVLDRECPPSVVREGSFDSLWKQMVALDWPALTIPEECGGLGMTFVDLAVVLEELGRVVAGGPLFSTVTQLVPALREAGATDELRKVANGELTGAIAFAGVVMGPADVVVTGSGELHAEWQADPINTLDTSRPLYRVDLPPVASERVIDEAVAALAVEMVGTCQTIFDMTLEYAKQREQFGVPIGSFQAIKHKLVDMYVMLSRARACAYFAAATVAEDDPRRPMAVSMAKAAAGDASQMICTEGIQIHGGIGYTWEHDLHLFVKRAKTGEALLGSAVHHRERVARLLNL